jgi:quercetin dioxygenase-like cupin family protein
VSITSDTARPKLTIAKANQPTLLPGRRATLQNRDLGTVEATGGRMHALVTSATKGMGPPSGWHYHICDFQLIYVLKGWVDFEAEDGTRMRIEPGDSLLVPGRMRHNVPGTADEIEVMTITVPVEKETVMCEPPAGF